MLLINLKLESILNPNEFKLPVYVGLIFLLSSVLYPEAR